MAINETHDPGLKSWVESANDPGTDFPIQNLPLCSFCEKDCADDERDQRIGFVIGDRVLDIRETYNKGYFDAWLKGHSGSRGFKYALSWGTTHHMLALPSSALSEVRARTSELLREGNPELRDIPSLRDRLLLPIERLELRLPISDIPNYTDFYASIHHASTVGAMFRPDNALLPNYKHVPIGYHGRASSIVVSGTPVRRPRGQQGPPENDPKAGPSFGPCKMLDYELEVGAFIGPGNELGRPIPIGEARGHVFGLCLVNDWSARDIQKWEYQPLGPFLAKNFGTTVSPFVVTMEALEPFRCPAYQRPEGDPRPLPYLFDESDQASGGFDITLEVSIASEEMRKRSMPPLLISKSNAYRDMYWTISQMVAHHSSNGCNLQPGDLLASGTVSGRGPTERGCLLEATWQGNGPDGKPLPRRPIELPTGEKRTFLADGDEVIMKGYCEREGFRRIGFGECRGVILPAEKDTGNAEEDRGIQGKKT
jgi:fumarylacetoacetase